MKILLVDDDEDDVDIFKDAIEQIDKNIHLIIGRNGLQCLELLDTLIPDLIFLDINMPLMNGKDCLIAIRKDVALDPIPVIMYSTSINAKDIQQFETLRANYLFKPSNFTALVSTLEGIVFNHLGK